MERYTRLTNLEVTGDIKSPGLPLLKKIGSIAYNSAASGTAVKVGSIPEGAIITRVICNVKTAFNAGSANTLIIGDAEDDDALMGSGDITAGSAAVYTKDVFVDSITDIYAKYTRSGTNPDAGAADIWVEYIR
jgi:hypothetical protein